MIVLRNMVQISDKFSDIFGKDYSSKIDWEEFVFKQIAFERMASNFSNALVGSKKQKDLEQFCELLFQLKDSKASICNFVKILLTSGSYDAIFYFMRRFIVGQFGNAKFSLSASGLGQQARLFERFLEVAHHADLKPAQFFPFVFACLQSEPNQAIFVWKEPAKLFLQAVYESEKSVLMQFMSQDEGVKQLLWQELGLSVAEDSSNNGQSEPIALVGPKFLSKPLLQPQTIAGKLPLQNNLQQGNNNAVLSQSNVATNAMQSALEGKEQPISQDTKVATEPNILKEPEFETNAQQDIIIDKAVQKEPEFETNTNLSQEQHGFINNQQQSNSLSFTTKITNEFLLGLGISSLEQFIATSEDNVATDQTFVFGQPIALLEAKFAGGANATEKSVAEMFKIVKLHADTMHLYLLHAFELLFEKSSLEHISQVLWTKLLKRASVLEAKWAVRFACVFANSNLEQEMLLLIKKWLTNKKHKEAKYMLTCMYYAHKPHATEFVSELILHNNDWAVSHFKQ